MGWGRTCWWPPWAARAARWAGERWQLWLAVVVGLALLGGGFVAGFAYASRSVGDFALLDEIRGLIETSYYRPSDAEQRKLLQGAARGMVQGLGDVNSFYLAPTERELYDQQFTGKYEGVGIHVDQRDSQLIITGVLDGGPAARAGLRPRDIVLAADGRRLGGLAQGEQIFAIRGPQGTPVTLTIRREGAVDPFDVTLIREEIQRISVRSRMLDNGLAVLRISQFTDETVNEAGAALDSLLSARPRGLLLDLRNSEGGLIGPAVEIAGFFLGGGTVLQTHARGQQATWDAPAGAPRTDLLMLVLIDRGTTSASEILAAALHDRGRAELVGERSFGKGTAQSVLRLSDGSGLRLTTAEWRSPTGRPLPTDGLEPDWPVVAPNPPTVDADPLLDAATGRLLALLNNQVR